MFDFVHNELLGISVPVVDEKTCLMMIAHDIAEIHYMNPSAHRADFESNRKRVKHIAVLARRVMFLRGFSSSNYYDYHDRTMDRANALYAMSDELALFHVSYRVNCMWHLFLNCCCYLIAES